MRPINNVVDVTNYVMLAVGQPLHGFDAAKIRGGKLIARRARPGEHIVTLDGIDRALRPDNLVIADTERALVIAGIFGAIDAEVDEHTTDLVLEAATFNGPNIMRTSKEVGWRSEASTRFEKGLDPCYVPLGLAMASRLFQRALRRRGGAGDRRRLGAAGPPAPPRLRYRPSLSDGLLGLPIAPAEQADILRRLECEVEPATGDDAGRRGRPRRHAAAVSPRPRAARRSGRRGRPHPRPREPARDAAARARRDRPADRPTSRCAGASPTR